ncbi:MAG: GH1 family beta-glucosidase [Chitinispirillaceae bacterium]
MGFPENFAWGAATASYQIEGGAYEDGKGLGIWDVYCKRPDTVWQGHTGDVACDHYHRYEQDVAVMQEIGLKAYRMELSWPRLLPDGTGRGNPRGFDFYDRLFDRLLEAGITPWVTLYHWNLPYSLQQRGGWQNPDSPGWFGEYVSRVMERYSDRITHWITLNEPQVVIVNGMVNGRNAPGLTLDISEALQAGHHLLLAHGTAVSAIRKGAKKKPCIGYAPVGWLRRPVSEDSEDVKAARKATFEVEAGSLWNSSWWMDPVFLGEYPSQGLECYGKDAPRIGPDDMKIIGQDIDFFGANLYTATSVRAGDDGTAQIVDHSVGHQMNTYDWAIVPDILYWAGKFYYERYRKPMVVTENGVPITEVISREGKVHDPQRTEFIAKHLIQLHRAMQEGVPYLGYFYWSLLDNFEWQWGYKHRFGLVYVDFETGERIVKDSARYYSEVIGSGGDILFS